MYSEELAFLFQQCLDLGIAFIEPVVVVSGGRAEDLEGSRVDRDLDLPFPVLYDVVLVWDSRINNSFTIELFFDGFQVFLVPSVPVAFSFLGWM